MEIFIGPKIPLSSEINQTLSFLDVCLPDVINAVLKDIRMVDEDNFDSTIERVISRAHSSWNDPRIEILELKDNMKLLESIIKQWLYSAVDFEILLYFYCRRFHLIESTEDQSFSKYFLDMEVLADDNYRRNPIDVRESVRRSRARFLNR